MKDLEPQKIKMNCEIPMSFHHLNVGEGKPLLVFFHGYSDSARAFLRRAMSEVDDRYEILAINGLFPVPQKKDGEWKQAFAWYFADFSAKSVLIHPEISAKAVAHLIERLGLQNRPKVLIGFSQGGFFLPYVIPFLKNVKYLFSVGAAYREQEYNKPLEIPLDALHGTEDDIVPLLRPKEVLKISWIKKIRTENSSPFRDLNTRWIAKPDAG